MPTPVRTMFSAGSAKAQGKLAAEWNRGKPLVVVFGASFALGVTKGWHVRFDDVRITAAP